MARIHLTIEIDVKNYPEIARVHKGDFAAMLADIPVINWIVQSKVDGEIESRIKERLGGEIAGALQPKLAEQGVDAEVRCHCS